jgi:hypothetical protein
MALLSPMERRMLRAATPAQAIVLVVGAPRSGTSLVFELLVTRARFAYFSNAAHRFWRAPAAATHLFRNVIRDWRGSLTSSYGHIPGWGAPSEGGWIWGRWTPEETTLTAAAAERVDLETMRRTIGAVSDTLAAPLVSKNVMHGVHLELLREAFPEMTLIHVRRDLADNARSILRARESDGDRAEWISVRPEGWDRLASEPPIVQCAQQVRLIDAQIDRDASRLGIPRLEIDYESVCDRPREIIDEALGWLEKQGVRNERRSEIPERLERRTGRRLSKEVESQLEMALEREREESAA